MSEPNGGHPRRWRILAVLVLSLLVVVLDNTVLNVALRTIADPVLGLGATQAQLEWSINAYTLVFAGLLFTAGILGDRYGRRRLLLLGLVVFGIASLASAYVDTPWHLVAARALMGLGASAVMPSTLSVIANVFDPRERGRAIAIWAGAVGLGVGIGPVVGGALLEKFWWGSVFLINVPIVTLAIVLIALLVPESRNPAPKRLDLVGLALSVLGLLALVYGIIDGGDHGFGRWRVWVSVAAGIALLALFVRHERRSDQPSMNVRLFRDPRFSAAIGATALVFFAGFGTLFFLSFYLQLVRGLSPLRAGLVLTPFAVAQVLLAPRSAILVRRYGPRTVCAAGLTLVTVALASYVFVGVTTPIWLNLVLMFVQGAGMANVVPPTTESVISTLPPQEAGVGSAVANIFRQVGGALGVAILGSVISAVYRREISDALAALPPPVRSVASESISATYGVANQVGPDSHALLSASNSAFVTAMHWSAGGSAVVAALGVFVAYRYLPRRANPNPAAPASEGAPAAGQAPPPAAEAPRPADHPGRGDAARGRSRRLSRAARRERR